MKNIRYLNFLVGILFCVSNVNAQVIKVNNKSTLKPINNVFIYNKTQNKSALTNDKGEALLDPSLPNDTIIIQHPSYHNQIVLFDSIEKTNFIIELQEQLIGLSEVVISANKWEQNLAEIPNKVVALKPSEISLDNPQTSADALGNTHQVFIQKSQLGGGSPMIRGFAANSLLIVVDGVRMNNAIYRSGNLQNVISLDPNSMEGMEVVFGPGSVVYGSDALGGVMDFHTKKAIPSYSNEIYSRGDAFMRYSSANNENTGHLDVNIGIKKIAFLTSVTHSQFDDLRAGAYRPKYKDFGKRPEYVVTFNGIDTIVKNPDENVQKHSAYKQLNLLQKVRWAASENFDLTYSFQYSNTSNVPRYDRLIEYSNDTTLKFAQWYYGPQIWMMNNLTANLKKKTWFYDNARFILAYQDYEESRNDRKFNKSGLRKRTEYVDLWSLNLDFDKKESNKFSTYYGAEVLANFVESDGVEYNIITGETEEIAPRYPDEGSEYYTFAGYISQRYKHNKKFTFTSGVRYSHVFAESKFSKEYYDFPYENIELNFGALNGSLGMVYSPIEELRVNLIASSGFRAPNIDDVAKVFDSEPGTVVVPNKNLRPEFSYNLDLGVLTKIGEKVKLDVTGYYTIIQDVIVRRNFTFNGQDSILYDEVLSEVKAQVNASEGYVYGVNGVVFFEFNEHIQLYSALNYSKGEDVTENLPLRHVPPTFGSSGITYSKDKLKLKFYSNYNGKIDFNNLAPSEQDKPHLYTIDGSAAWYTLNLKGSYNIAKNICLSAGVENISDLHYRPYSSGISAPGRNFMISLKTSF